MTTKARRTLLAKARKRRAAARPFNARSFTGAYPSDVERQNPVVRVRIKRTRKEWAVLQERARLNATKAVYLSSGE